MNAIDDIAAERRRQIEAEGWTPAHDDEHEHGELAWGAACYAANAGCAEQPKPMHTLAFEDDDADQPPEGWPWDIKWWKPKDRRCDLVRAGALIVAEIERLDRLHDRAARQAMES